MIPSPTDLLSDEQIKEATIRHFCALDDHPDDWGDNSMNMEWFHAMGLPYARALLAAAATWLGVADEWYCEIHPEHLMGHDGCKAPGVEESCRIHMLLNKLRLAEQETRETAMVRDDLAAKLRAFASMEKGAPVAATALLGALQGCVDAFAFMRSKGIYVWPNHPANPEQIARAAIAAATEPEQAR